MPRHIESKYTEKDKSSFDYSDFWSWFYANENVFYKAVESGNNIEEEFIDPLSKKLQELRDGYFFLVGMIDEHTVELVFTADGIIKNIAFVEDLVKAAPLVPGWKFVAFKQATDMRLFDIDMEHYSFKMSNLFFFPDEDAIFPDKIDISIVYNECKGKADDEVVTGVYAFLDNFLGEIEAATTIDSVKVLCKDRGIKDLIPIDKLKGYLNWREKEFVEKYGSTSYNPADDSFSTLTATHDSGSQVIMFVNSGLLDWEGKASHPWILIFTISYNGKNTNGFPDEDINSLLLEIENELIQSLPDHEGHLNIGRQTGRNQRNVYFACKNFYKASRISERLANKYSRMLPISWDIYKDKYWESFKRFKV